MAEKLIPLEDAQSIVLSHVAPTDLVEIPVWQAAGLPLAEDAVADIDISPFANSAMDGYAVRTADLVQASGEAPVTLEVIGHEAAGHVFEGAIGAGDTVRIMTGAPVPEGADAVVKYEIVDVLDGDVGGGCGHGDGGAAGIFRKGFRRILQKSVRVRVAHVKEGVDAVLFVLGEGFFPHQVVDIDSVTEVGRNPSGGGVGLFKEPHRKERRQVVPDGGGRNADSRHFGEGLRPDGLAGFNIGFNYSGKNLLFSLVEPQSPRPLSVRFCFCFLVSGFLRRSRFGG